MTLLKHSKIFENLISEIDLSFLKQGRILICGGTGLVGGYLAAALAYGCREQGVHLASKILVTGRRRDHHLHNLEREGLLQITRIESILNEDARSKFSHTFHAASPASPNEYLDASTLHFLNHDILKKLVGITSESFFYFSTGEVYGTQAPLAVDESHKGVITSLATRAAYPISKIKGEQLLQGLAEGDRCSVKIMRLFHTFGPGVSPKDPRAFSTFLYQAVEDGTLRLRSSGSQVRSFLHLADTIRGISRISTRSHHAGAEVFNVGSPIPVSIHTFADVVAELTNAQLTYESQTDYELSPNNMLVPSVGKLQSLGWEQKISLTESIQDVLTWLKLSQSEKQF